MDARQSVQFVADLLVLGAVYVACLTALMVPAVVLGALKQRVPNRRGGRWNHASSR